jgi:hypothetical protein
MPHSYFYLNRDYIIKVNANFLALGSATIDYITFKGSTVEPGYRQGPNPDGPAMISLLKQDSCAKRMK